jgi:hypothetical protein
MSFPSRNLTFGSKSSMLWDIVSVGRSFVMAKNREKLAQLLGAKIVGEVPDVGGGAFGMARLARILHERLTPSQGDRPGRPTNPQWVHRPKVPMSEATVAKLARIAQSLSDPERKVSPMQVAAQLLEEALGRVPESMEGNGAIGEHGVNTLAPSSRQEQ